MMAQTKDWLFYMLEQSGRVKCAKFDEIQRKSRKIARIVGNLRGKIRENIGNIENIGNFGNIENIGNIWNRRRFIWKNVELDDKMNVKAQKTAYILSATP